METPKGFEFLSADNKISWGDALVGVVPAGIVTPQNLLEEIAKALQFPSYFGANWNALYDCLRDFYWVKNGRVILVHRDVPRLADRDLKIYLDVLKDAAADWTPEDYHELLVVFDYTVKDHVLGVINM